MKTQALAALLFLTTSGLLSGDDKSPLVHSWEIFPTGEINILQYTRMVSPSDELILGLIYYDPSVMNALHYPGTQRIYSLEVGYRRYLWNGLHLELQLDPQWSVCTVQSSGETLQGFGLVSEIRLGYRFDFQPWDWNISLVPQFVGGYYLINSRPESFVQADKDRCLYPLYLIPIPMIFLGIRY